MNTSDSVDVETIKQTLIKLMAIADRLDTRNLQTAKQLEEAVDALEQRANCLSGSGEEFAGRALAIIGSRAEQSIVQGTESAAHQVRQRLEHTAASAQTSAQVLERETGALQSARRTLVWSGLIALLLGSLLAAGGAAWVAHQSMEEIAQAHFAKDILQATRTGAITRCGDVLCVRVGKAPRRFGAHDEYVLLQ